MPPSAFPAVSVQPLSVTVQPYMQMICFFSLTLVLRHRSLKKENRFILPAVTGRPGYQGVGFESLADVGNGLDGVVSRGGTRRN